MRISAEVVEKALEAFHATDLVKWADVSLNEDQKNILRWNMLQAIRAAVLAEREACAAIFDNGVEIKFTGESGDGHIQFPGKTFANLIRSRPTPTKAGDENE